LKTAGETACRWKLISIAHPKPENAYAPVLDGMILKHEARRWLAVETERK